MSLNTSMLIDFVVTGTVIEHGGKPKPSKVPASAFSKMKVVAKYIKAPEWTEEEEQFLKDNLGKMREEEIALILGRTKTAVHLHWKRDMYLCAPSKAPDIITAERAAQALGVDSHKVEYWVDIGLIPRGRLMAGDRKIRLIPRISFMVWACAPRNWVYFDPKRVTDPHLKRLLRLEAKRWGDEWWSTRKAGDFHGEETKTIQLQIKMGRLPGSFHLTVSRGGRHPKLRWSNWLVLKSEVIKLKIPHHSSRMCSLTPRGKAWIKKALAKGMNATDIGRMMGYDPQTILNWIHRYFPKAKLVKGRAGWSRHHGQ